MEAEQLRRARNEALFREVNERIAELEDGVVGEDDSLLTGFVCECPNDECGETVEITRRQYEMVRSDPRRFVVLPGHEDLDLARVVEHGTHFLVVEKRGGAAEVATELDPRS